MARRTEDEGEEMDDRLAEAQAQIESLQTAAADAEARARLPKAAVKYREAKLASAPDVPHDRVPQAESLAEIDEGFEAARRVVGELRERMQEERQSARVTAGSPVRRAPDPSSLPAAEKIKLGLRELSECEGR